VAQRTELEQKLGEIDTTAGQVLDQKLVLLELSQKAAELYPTRSPEQKWLIITSLFKGLGTGIILYLLHLRILAGL